MGTEAEMYGDNLIDVDDSGSYHEIYEGLFIGHLSFVQVVESKGN